MTNSIKLKAGLNKVLCTMASIGLSLSALAQEGPKISSMSNPLVQVMVVIMVLLLIAIIILVNVVKNSADIFTSRNKPADMDDKGGSKISGATSVVAIIGALTLLSLPSTAQTAADAAAPVAAVVDNTINGLKPGTFYLMMGVIALEILVIIGLMLQMRYLLGLEKKKEVTLAAAAGVGGVAVEKKQSWWDRINRSISIDREKEIDLNHDFDGIRELDNNIPPWWTVAFLASILFGVVYMWRYHVAKTAPLQLEELRIAMEEGEAAKKAYLVTSASNVDESNVTMSDETGINSAKALFTANCATCHGAEGQGAAVGPNLIDDYWIHGGKLQDIFKTIKYGVPEKGMMSWKSTFTPQQMADLASFVKAQHGKKFPDAKEKQGELFTEAAATPAAAADSTKPAADSTAATK